MSRVSKLESESVLFDRFIDGYKKLYASPLIFIKHRDRPDFEFIDKLTNNKFGLEITGVYQDDEEAKLQFETVEGEFWSHGSLEKIVKRLNSRLKAKSLAVEKYLFDYDIWLAVFIGSPIYNQKFDIDWIHGEIVVPPSRFSKIWLLITSKDNSSELYPL